MGIKWAGKLKDVTRLENTEELRMKYSAQNDQNETVKTVQAHKRTLKKQNWYQYKSISEISVNYTHRRVHKTNGEY